MQLKRVHKGWRNRNAATRWMMSAYAEFAYYKFCIRITFVTECHLLHAMLWWHRIKHLISVVDGLLQLYFLMAERCLCVREADFLQVDTLHPKFRRIHRGKRRLRLTTGSIMSLLPVTRSLYLLRLSQRDSIVTLRHSDPFTEQEHAKLSGYLRKESHRKNHIFR